MFFRTSSVATDSPARTASHVQDTGGRSRSVATLLRERRAGGLIPAYLVRRLQSVLNASAQLIHHLRRSEQITGALVSLHWLRVPERNQHNTTVLAYKVLYWTAPRHLGPLVRVSGLPGQRALRSASTSRLIVQPFKLSTIGSRTFEVTVARRWNDLPEDVTSSPTVPFFCNRLKTNLFRQSYPDIVLKPQIISFITVALR